jgi:hypothetical protein
MEPFRIQGINNSYTYYNPNPKAKYGLAFSFWYSNVKDLIFITELIQREWINKEFIDISVASYASPNEEEIARLSKVVNYIVKVDEDRGHQDGTTAHCNAALYPLMQQANIECAAHTDADVPFINQTYFFGFIQMLKDSEKLILTCQDTHLYDLDNLTSHVYTGHDIDQTRQFGSVFILNKSKALSINYFPFTLEGHFERDRFTHFVRCGCTTEKDALIIKRVPIDVDLPNNFLYSFDVNLGVVHQTNMIEDPETADRKIRLLQLMYYNKWDNMLLGFKHNYNPKSPRKANAKTN